MAENYAALMDASNDIAQVIVIPEGEDAETYCPSIGLSGTWKNTADLPGIGWREVAGEFYPHWFQIVGAGAGPEGAESGFAVGDEMFHDGAVWISTTAFNVFIPGVAGWHRKDRTWVQPSGAADAYDIGDKVFYGGTEWENTQAANVFAPGVAGWTDLNAPAVSPWVQPTGGHNAYPLGAQVTHNGKTWENTGSNANVWAPGVFGWVEV